MFTIKPKMGTFPASILSNCCVRRSECMCSHCHFHNPDSPLARDYIAKLWDREHKEQNIHNKVIVQSGEALDVEVSTEVAEVEQNVEFTDAVDQYSLVIGRTLTDNTFSMAEVGDADGLAHFMERPVRIFSKEWEVGESP